MDYVIPGVLGLIKAELRKKLNLSEVGYKNLTSNVIRKAGLVSRATCIKYSVGNKR